MNFAKIIVVLTVVSAAIMELIDTSIVNVGLSQMGGSLGVTIEDVSWVITAYAIANVVIIPLTGFFQRYFGRKNYYLASIFIFTIASYFCGTADNLWTLVFFRFIQGIGGGALLSVSQGILFDTFSLEQRPMASAMFGIGIVLGPTFGPTLGGIIIDNYHWSWMFYINLPIGLLAFLLSYFFIEKKPEELKIDRSKISVDTFGILLLALWVGPLQYVLERGSADDWFESPTIFRLTILVIVSLISFVWWELSTPNPIVDLKVFRNRNLTIGVLLTVVVGFGLFGSVFLYPLFAQRIIGFGAKQTGLLVIPGTVIALFFFPLIGKLLAKGAQPRNFVLIGYVLFFCFVMAMSRLNAETSATFFLWIMLLRGMGLAFTNLPLINSSVSTLSPKDLPMGIAMTNMFRQMGGALGIAVINTYINHQSAIHRNDLLSNFVPGSPAFEERMSAVTGGLIGRGINALEAPTLALSNLRFIVEKQALMISYLDCFQLTAAFFAVTLPFIFFIQKKKPNLEAIKAASEAH
jgi:MFS transporter, DHA2 family, multidrug resistance protein